MDLMEKIVNLTKRRGFIFPGSEIYGGLANSWDYGELGAYLRRNIMNQWWDFFVGRRTDMIEISPAVIMNSKVWEASGHLKEFSDPLVECKECHNRFRQDVNMGMSDIPNIDVNNRMSDIQKLKCPSCGSTNLTKSKTFNLLFKTFLGPTEEKATEVYLRPELAQAMFVDLPQVLQTSRRELPFGIAAQGRVFRNEITPGNFIFRTREFDLMEFEYFVPSKDDKKWFDYWLGEMHRWLEHLGVKKEHLHDKEVPAGERAHYSQRTVDIEYDYPFGRGELYGLANRGDYDLKAHKIDLAAYVIEPTFGLDRSVLVAMLEAYSEEQAPTAEKGETDLRVVMKFPVWLAPFRAAVLPLSKKPELEKIAKPIHEDLRKAGIVADYDETQSIGRRYRRQDEIGTPYCVTVDFDTLKDRAVTVRDRDTMKQERVKIANLRAYLQGLLTKMLFRRIPIS